MQGINIRCEDNNSIATIDIDGPIGYSWENDWDKQNVQKRIKEELEAISKIEAKEIIVNINSLGGDFRHAISIHDLLKANKAKVTTVVTGMVASAGTLIAMAGDVRKASSNILFLTHKASTGFYGNSNEAESTLDTLKKVDEVQVKIYTSAGVKESDIKELMEADNGNGRWLTADEAKEYGFITEIYESKKIAARYSENEIKAAGLPIINTNKNFKMNVFEMLSNVLGKKVDANTDVTEIETSLNNVLSGPQEIEARVKGMLKTFDEQIEAKFKDLDTSAAFDRVNEVLDALKNEISEIKAGLADEGEDDGDSSETFNAKKDTETISVKKWYE